MIATECVESGDTRLAVVRVHLYGRNEAKGKDVTSDVHSDGTHLAVVKVHPYDDNEVKGIFPKPRSLQQKQKHVVHLQKLLVPSETLLALD